MEITGLIMFHVPGVGMLYRIVRPLCETRHGKVVFWDPLSWGMCDALVEFEDGSQCFYSSRDLRPVDGLGSLPSRDEARRRADAVALRELREIRASLVEEVKHGPQWPGCEFGKAFVGMGVDGAIKEIE